MKHGYALLLAALVPVAARAITITGNVTPPTCNQADGCIDVFVSGGVPPYTYNWSPVPANGQGTPSICGLAAGIWTVTVTDSNAEDASQAFNLPVFALNVLNSLTYFYEGSAAHHPCIGQQEGSFSVLLDQLGGTPPYTILADGQPPLFYDPFTSNPVFGYYLPFSPAMVSVTDANGCTGSDQFYMDGISTTPFAAENINPACGGQANGSASLTIGYSGPYGPSVNVAGPGGQVYNSDPMTDPLQLIGLEAGLYTVVRTYNPIYMASLCQFVHQFTIPDLGVDCGTVSGEVFIDNDQDCVHDGNEVAVPYRVLTITPGPEYAITDGNGHYTRNVADGNHAIMPQGADLYPICPVVQPVPFTINGDAAIIDFADSSLVQLDLGITSGANAARVGFVQTVWAHISNASAQLSGAVTLTLAIDPQMSFISALPAPANVSGNLVTWSFPAFGAYASANLNVQIQVPADIGLLGNAYIHTWGLDQPIAESSLANNAWSISGTITAAYDPNDKNAQTSSRWSDALYYIDQDEWIDYTIRFQNTGTDTAFNVVVTDTIAPELDLSTFEHGVASHAFAVEFKDGRVVEWRFTDILLPDSNVNEPASHGVVQFRIKPILPLLAGTVIENIANIYFDFNPPVITEPSVLVAEFSTGVGEVSPDQLHVFPVPTLERLNVHSNTLLTRLSVLTLDGRMVREEPVQGHRATMDLQGLSSGAYLIRATDTAGNHLHQPFVIEHE